MSSNTYQSEKEDEEGLNKVFDGCDSVFSGQVRSQDLIDSMKQQWLNASADHCSERERKICLNDLKRRLDPRGDNGYLERAYFIKCGLEWIKKIRVIVFLK